MKTLQLTLIALLIIFSVKAQTNPAYVNAMKNGLGMLQGDSTSEQFLEAANYFDRIAQAEPKEWLAHYYAGYTYLLVAVLGKQPNDQKDVIYDKAINFAQQANKLKLENSEVYVLLGYITFMKMAVDAPNRAMTMITLANDLLDKAVTLNQENPRSYLVRGQDTFFTPEAFGGGPVNTKPLFLLAKQKFEKENMTGLEPSWGRLRNETLLAMCK